MFDKLKFSQILNKINNTYDTMTEFSMKSGVNRTYLSQYINQKLDSPPSPKVLMKIANASNGIATYNELMQVCGYIFVDELTDKSFGIRPAYWNLIFGNVSKVKLSSNGSTFLASIIDKGLQEANKAENRGKNTFMMDFNPDLLIPHTDNIDELIEYTKIFCFFICSLISTMSINENEKKQLLKNVRKLLKSIPADQKEDNNISKYYMCPVYGRIAAGEPNWAEECMEGYLPIDPNLMNIVNPEECFFLRVNGESMNKVIKNGAFALIRKTNWVEDGEIAVVLVNGYDATLKKFKRLKKSGFIMLEPQSNSDEFEPIIIDPKETDVKIIGKYIGKMEMN